MSGYEFFKDTLNNRYAQFYGRARRSEYWYFWLFSWLAGLCTTFLADFIFSSWLATVISAIVSIILFIPSLAVLVRRLHDTNRSGWWLLLIFIPVIGLLILLYFLITDGDEGMNEYGPNPKTYQEDDFV